MLRIWQDSWHDFRMIHRKVLLFESLFILLSGFVFVPFFSWIFDRILRSDGNVYLVNSEVLRYAYDFKGLLSYIILGSLMVFLFFSEIGALVVLSQKIYFGHRATVMDALATVIRRIPRLLGIGMIQFFLIMILLAPLIDSPMLNYLLSGYNLDILILNPARQSLLRTILLLVLGLLVFILVCRQIFSLHLIIIRGMSMGRAIRASWRLTHGRMLKISAVLVAANFFVFGLVSALLILLNYIPVWLGISDRIMFMQSIILVFTGYIGFVLTIVLIPLNIIIITRLYYFFQPDLKDNLVLSGSWLAGKAERRFSEVVAEHKKTFRFLLFILLSLTFVLNTQIYSKLAHARWNVMIAAHRGMLVEAPENTLAAVEAALLLSVDYVEIDVQLTADNHLVLFHDNSLRRIDGTDRMISNMTLAEVSRVDAGSWFAPEFANERIPTLEDIILYVGERSKLLIDVKLTSEPEAAAAALAELIGKYELTDTCLVQSFSPRVLAELRKINPQIKLGQVLMASSGRLERMDIDFYTISQSMLTESFIEMARSQNRQVWVWTVNSVRNIQTVLQYDINGIISDYPQRVRQIGGFEDILIPPDPVSQLTAASEESQPVIADEDN